MYVNAIKYNFTCERKPPMASTVGSRLDRKYPRVNERMATSIHYNTCDKSLKIKRLHTDDNTSWYGIYTPGIPTRYVQLSGVDAMDKFVRNYGYLDGKGCVNHRDKIVEYNEAPVLDSKFNINPYHRKVNGVPQRVYNSGLCWYCALCFVLFFSHAMRKFILSYLPADLQELARKCLFDAEIAEKLRRQLYDTIAFGDKPDQPPEKDGQNGIGQFFIMAAKFDIPVTRLLAPTLVEMTEPIKDQTGEYHAIQRTVPHDGESGMLVVRCFRTQWKPTRRIMWKNKRYRLVGIMIGSEECGHQIGVSTRTNCNITQWALSDSDASQHGIGPMFWNIPRSRDETRQQYKNRWHAAWDKLIPVTMFGSGREQFCNLSPNNSNHLSTSSSKTSPGLVNPDYIYLHVP